MCTIFSLSLSQQSFFCALFHYFMLFILSRLFLCIRYSQYVFTQAIPAKIHNTQYYFDFTMHESCNYQHVKKGKQIVIGDDGNRIRRRRRMKENASRFPFWFVVFFVLFIFWRCLLRLHWISVSLFGFCHFVTLFVRVIH